MNCSKWVKWGFIFAIVMQFAVGQTAWDSGSIQFNYGTFMPTETWSASGTIIPDSVGSGAGGFLTSNNDTSRVFAMAYQMDMVDTSLVADVFVLMLTDTGSINTGTYPINPLANPTTIFAWIPQLSSEFLMQLISGTVAPDSLFSLNLRIATTGSITVNQAPGATLDMAFQGVLFDPTTLQTYTVANGAINLDSTLPLPDFMGGALSFDMNGESFNAEGNFNPILGSSGAGGITTVNGDTLNYSLMAFSTVDFNTFNVFGLTIVTTDPMVSGNVNFAFPGASNVYPQAQGFYLHNASLADVYQLLSNPSMSSLDSLTTTDIYIAASGNVTFTRNVDAWDGTFSAQMAPVADMPVLVPLENGQFHLSNQPVVAIAPEKIHPPTQFQLGKAYPNPFNPDIHIPFTINTSGLVHLDIYDLKGRLVNSLVHRVYEPGQYMVNWKPQNHSSGIYLVRLSEGITAQTQRLVYVK